MKKTLILLFILTVFNSCKSTKTLSGATLKNVKAEKVISNHYNRSFNFKTLNARVKVRYQDGKNSASPNVSLRMEKDKTIWLSAKLLGITLAKVKITPDKVSYYEKINKTYFEGDFEFLSKWLGTSLDFEKVQNLLLAQALFDLRQDKYKTSISEKTFKLTPKKQLALFERLFMIHPQNFKVTSQQLMQSEKNRKLTVNYTSFQKVGNQDFPKEIYIEALQETKKTILEINYKTVDYNAKVSFPFTIPSGYDQLKVE